MAESRLTLDASAAIALLRREPWGPRVAQLLREERARMCMINAAETVDVLIRVHRWSADDVVVAVEQLLSVVAPVSVSIDLALAAGEIRARKYDPRTSRLSIADCFCLAIADAGDRIVTSDRTLASVARAEGYEVVAPD